MIDVLTNESFLSLLCINVIAAVGMNIVYTTGQLNLGQAGFFAIGAYAVAVTNHELGWALLTSLALAAILAAIVALPVAAATSRLRGIYLIIGTLAIGEIVRVSISNVDGLGGVEGYPGIDPISAQAIYAICAVTVIAAAVLMATPLGIRMRSLFDDQDAAAAAGVPTRQIRTVAVVLSAATVALAGGLFARTLLFIAPRDFGLDLSFEIALFTLIGGVHSILGALVGATLITALLEVLRRAEDIMWIPREAEFLAQWRFVVLGLLVMLLIALLPEGAVSRRLALRLTRPARGLQRRIRRRSRGRGKAETQDHPSMTEPVLVARSIRHAFGGVRALDGVDLTLEPGEVVALIGANGAGKSTLVDVISGRHRLQDGTLEVCGRDVADWRPERRTRLGLSRTFQAVRSFAHLTVDESLRLGQMSARAGDREPLDVHELKELVGLDAADDALPESLSLADQRRLELGRALASAPAVVLLDEPSAGINDDERKDFAEIVRRIQARGIAVLVIDHNLDFALSVADRAIALDYGRLIAEAAPDRLLEDPGVRSAYLGEPEVVAG